jgi:hypothetical protein
MVVGHIREITACTELPISRQVAIATRKHSILRAHVKVAAGCDLILKVTQGAVITVTDGPRGQFAGSPMPDRGRLAAVVINFGVVVVVGGVEFPEQLVLLLATLDLGIESCCQSEVLIGPVLDRLDVVEPQDVRVVRVLSRQIGIRDVQKMTQAVGAV